MVAAGAEDPTVGATLDTWVIRGSINGTGWQSDITMEMKDNLLVAKDVTFDDTDNQGAQFKVLKNGEWSGTENAKQYNVGEPIYFSVGKGDNIAVNATLSSVKYDIYLSIIKHCVCVVKAGDKPTI